jgi:hypothetical protein
MQQKVGPKMSCETFLKFPETLAATPARRQKILKIEPARSHFFVDVPPQKTPHFIYIYMLS